MGLTAVILAFSASAVANENWPHWRGPARNGVSDSTNLPTQWGPDTNIVWKTDLPSWSAGTAIIWGDLVFVTSASSRAEDAAQPAEQPAGQGAGRGPAGRAAGGGRGAGGRGGAQRRPGGRGGGGADQGGGRDPGGDRLLLLCLSKTTGDILWRRELDTGNELQRKQNLSSPSPVTDGQHVWVVTGTGMVTAFDMAGEELWKFNLQTRYGRFGHNWGYSSSPVLEEGRLIIQVLHGMNTDDPSYLVSWNAMTGEQIWHQERPTDAQSESPDAYTTPVILEQGGRKLIVISGGDYVTAHDFETGQEVWRQAGLNPQGNRAYRIVASASVADGMIYAPTRNRPLLALRTEGANDVSRVWQWDENTGPDVPTPVTDGERFYMVSDSGIVNCLDAKTGQVLWQPPVRTAQGTVSSSPLLADGKLYVINESAVTTVLSVAADSPGRILATNSLDGGYTLASIAVSGSQLFIRTEHALYCIGAAQ
jgi:outer membrane protein assembly factor BamB